jgi:TonB-dependent SusC/RagA subfamily outer membrane receptor
MIVPARWIAWSALMTTIIVPLCGTRARSQTAESVAGDTAVRRWGTDSVPGTGAWLPRLQTGASIGTIRADTVVPAAPVFQFTDLLTARLPGVDVQSGGGMSGGGARITIRGGGSLVSGSDPVIYLDGIRIDGNPPRFMGVSISEPPTPTNGALAAGRLEDLSPNEIERIDVLTGPAATTQYGIDAWNGVVLVTTKRPSSATAEWSAFAEEGALTPPPPRAPDSYYGWGHTTATPSAATACGLQAQVSGSCVQDSVTHFSPLSDRATTPLANGYRDHYGLQAGGTAGPGRYFLSGDRQSETGILEMPAPDVQLFSAQDGAAPLPGQIRPNSLDRTNLRATLGANVGGRADITIFGNAIGGDHRATDDAGLAEAAAFGSGSSRVNDGWLGDFIRPRSLFANEDADRIWRDILGGSFTWRILDAITAHVTAGTDHADAHSVELIRAIDAQTEGLSDGVESDAHQVTNEQTGDVDVSGVIAVGRGWSSRTSLGAQLRDEGETDVGRVVLGSGIETLTNFQQSSARQRGAYVEETVSQADRLSLTAALRAEGPTGLFGKATEGLPRIAASWTPVEHGGDALHIHAAYGRTSNLPVAPGYYLGIQATTTGLFVPITEAAVPEHTSEYEAGLDASLLHERLTFGGTVYDRTIDHMSFEVPVSPSVGGEEILNTGVVRNRGVELSLTARAIRTPMFSWDASLSVWTNANRVITLYPGATGFELASPFNAPIYRVVPGAALYSTWQPNLTYHDQNGDGIIEPGEVTLSNPADQGSALPTRGATLQNGFGLLGGRFRVGVLADYKGGNRMIDPVLYDQFLFGTSRGSVDPHAPLAEQAQALAATEGTYAGPAQDASFVRLRELSITVNGTPSIARALRTRSVTLSLLARNLWLWTSYKGTDPEINTNNNADPVASYTVVPLPRYFVARVTIGY